MKAVRVKRVVRIPRRDTKLGRWKGVALFATNHGNAVLGVLV